MGGCSGYLGRVCSCSCNSRLVSGRREGAIERASRYPPWLSLSLPGRLSIRAFFEKRLGYNRRQSPDDCAQGCNEVQRPRSLDLGVAKRYLSQDDWPRRYRRSMSNLHSQSEMIKSIQPRLYLISYSITAAYVVVKGTSWSFISQPTSGVDFASHVNFLRQPAATTKLLLPRKNRTFKPSSARQKKNYRQAK